MTSPAPVAPAPVAPVTLEALYNLVAQTRQAVYENMDRTDALNERVTAVLLEGEEQNASLGPRIIPKLERALAKIERLEAKIAALEAAGGALSPSIQCHMAPLSGEHSPGPDFYDERRPSEDGARAHSLLPIVPTLYSDGTLHVPFPFDPFEGLEPIKESRSEPGHPVGDAPIPSDALLFTPEQCRDLSRPASA